MAPFAPVPASSRVPLPAAALAPTRVLATFLFLGAIGVLLAPIAAPAQDVPRQTIVLEELWRRGTFEDDLIFGNIDRIRVADGGEVFALDTQLSEILVLDPDGAHLRTIGGAGEGPGEFQGAADMFLGLGGRVGVLQAFPGKIVQLEPSGVPLSNLQLESIDGDGFRVLLRAHASEERLVLAGTVQERRGDQQMQKQFLDAYDAEGNFLHRFHAESHPFQWGGMQYEEETFVSFQRRWVAAPDGRVMAPLSYEEYAVQVWSADGEPERVIRREVEPLRRSEEQLEITQQLFDAVISFNPRSSFEVSEIHPAITQMFARPDGELWVASARGVYERPAGAVLVLDVFDREGAFVRQVELRGDLDPEQDSFYLIGDRLYAVTGALGAAMSALGGGDEGGAYEEVEPSNIACFALRPAD